MGSEEAKELLEGELIDSVLTKREIIDSLSKELYEMSFVSDQGDLSYAAEIRRAGRNALEVELDNGSKFTLKIL